ncbi:MAG: ComEC/Rec2 family competence protein [Pseudomonadota bacterium]
MARPVMITGQKVALHLREALLVQRGGLIEWVPVCLAIGIGLYFSLKFEPTMTLIAAAAGLGLCLAGLAWRVNEAFSPLIAALVLVLCGALLAAQRAHSVAGPVLGFRYYGPIEGRVVALDRSASDAVRVTLDQVRLDDVVPWRTPTRVRISLHGDAALGPQPVPGARVMSTGHLSPPGGPVEPGGFDFQRHAWFKSLGAVGYTRVPVLTAAPPDDSRWSLIVFRVRMAISAHVRAVLPGDVGGFAAAVTTGDRSGISQDALDDLRASNTAHLLAISGLHMGLLSALIFGVVRGGLAAIPYTALHWPNRKIAAVAALGVAAFYLAMSGGNIATERAFIMVAVALIALLMDRRALSLRAVAMAAIIVLILRPEALLSPGFQMSFAATTALVAVFGWMRDGQIQIGPAWAQGLVGVFLASAISGLATAPVGAAHFNTVSNYGLLANLLSVPLMGVLIIPAAVLAALLAPFGLDWVGLELMGLGLQWTLGVADYTANLPGAQRFVTGPQTFVLPMITLGALFCLLWRGRPRFAGLIVAALGLGLWQVAERPALLIADTGALVGVLTQDGRALSRARGAGFVAQNWLENDGDGVSQSSAAERWRDAGSPPRWHSMDVGLVRVLHGTGKRAAAEPPPCKVGQILVTNTPLGTPPGPCDVFDPVRLRKTGAVALVHTDKGLALRTARDVSGDRMWTAWSK